MSPKVQSHVTEAEQLIPQSDESERAKIEFGSFAPPGEPSHANTRLVVATFNIRYAVGSFLITGSLFRRAGFGRPARRPSLVSTNILAAARVFTDGRLMPPADIVCLQEADRETVRAGGRHVASELARELHFNYAHAANEKPEGEEPKRKQWYLDFEEHIHSDETGTTGVATLSHLPFADVARVELPWSDCAWRPRLALATSFRVGHKRLHVINAHIDPHSSVAGQLAQHETILHRALLAGDESPVIILGDFNTLLRPSRDATRRLLESHGYTSPQPSGTPTWRAGLYRLHADWIFARGLRFLRWGVARPLSVSDHWPVWAEVELDAEAKG